MDVVLADRVCGERALQIGYMSGLSYLDRKADNQHTRYTEDGTVDGIIPSCHA